SVVTHQRLAERWRTVGPAPDHRVRGFATTAAYRLDRPLPDAPRRPRHAVGGDLAGDAHPDLRRQDPLRRLSELRRLAPRREQPRRAPAASARAGQRAMP